MRFLAQAAAGLAILVLSSCGTLGGMTFSNDPYLWLEDVEGEQALAWVRERNASALAQLEGDSRFAQLHADALAIANSQDRLALGAVRDGYLYNFWQDETNVRGIWRRSPLADYARGAPVWETLLDIDALAAAESANWVYKGVDCLENSNRCMVSLSDGGKDAVVWREFDIATRSFVVGGFSLPEAKSSVTWVDVDNLLIATDWGLDNGAPTLTESGYPYVVKQLARGAALASAVEVLRGQASDVGVFTASLTDVDGSRTLLVVQAVTFFESANWLIRGGAPERVTLPPKATVRGVHKGNLIATLEESWTPQAERSIPSGALVAITLEGASGPSPSVSVLYAPGPRESIEAVEMTRDAVLVAGYENVRGRILRFAFDGRAWIESQVAIPPNGAVGFAGASPTEEIAFATFEDFLTPDSLYAIEERATRARVVRTLPPQFDAAPYVSEQFEATSRDGTRVPYFVVRARDQQANRENPTLLYAYGGFQVSMLPSYNPFVGKMWLERGGTYVLANIRGGGEFGPAWHQAGLRTNRQVIFDDFYAVEQDLVARGITIPRRLGIMGGSNGGLLMGVMLNQHPEMINAAVVQVPLLDMLRYDQLLAGASWVDEYGSPADRDEGRFLRALSPYHNVRNRPDFPVPFVLTSTKDDRVHPGHARKYVARLQELGMPVLYYENIDGGHSAAANLNEAARRRSLEYTYLMQRLMD